MMDEVNQSSEVGFETKIEELYKKLKGIEINHFELLGLLKTATHREIESAYKKSLEEFSLDKINMLSDPELKNKATFVAERINHAFKILIDYDKRAEYEKRGFRDVSPEDEVEENPVEMAKEIFRKAKVLFGQGEYRKVATVMEEVVRLDPERPDYFLFLGKSQSRIPGLKRQAEENLNKALEKEPWNVEPHAALGMLFYSERLYKRAESYFRKALSIEPDHAQSRKILTEIVGPEKKPFDGLKKGLKKVFPSVFDRKKK